MAGWPLETWKQFQVARFGDGVVMEICIWFVIWFSQHGKYKNRAEIIYGVSTPSLHLQICFIPLKVVIYYHVVSDNHIIASVNSSGTLRANSTRVTILNAFFLSLFAIVIHAAPLPQDNVRTIAAEGFTSIMTLTTSPTTQPLPEASILSKIIGQSYYYNWTAFCGLIYPINSGCSET